jgi:hypothetical protein
MQFDQSIWQKCMSHLEWLRCAMGGRGDGVMVPGVMGVLLLGVMGDGARGAGVMVRPGVTE